MNPPPPIHRALDFVAARRMAGLSDETMAVLLRLRQHGVSAKEALAAATGINPTTLPRYLSQLVASGHLARQGGVQDRREVFFVLTAHGERLVEALLKHFPAPENGDRPATP